MAKQVMIPFLVAMMLLTGVCNTLLSKYQVRQRPHSFPRPSLRVTGSPMRSQLRLDRPKRDTALFYARYSNVTNLHFVLQYLLTPC